MTFYFICVPFDSVLFSAVLKSSIVQWLFQVILHSQVKATLTIYDSWLDLQHGFHHIGKGDGRPTSGFFPLVVCPTSRAGILFSICSRSTDAGGDPSLNLKSVCTLTLLIVILPCLKNAIF